MYAVQLDDQDDGPAQLTITGTVTDEGGSFGLGFALRRKAVAQPVDEHHVTWLAVDLVGSDGEILSSSAVPAVPVCFVPDADTAPSDELTLLVDTLVPLIDEVRWMVIRSEERVLLERKVSKNPPVVGTVEATDVAAGTCSVSWTVEHPDGFDLATIVIVSYDDGLTWRPLTMPIEETKAEVAVAPPAGVDSVTFGVVTSDGFNTVLATTEPVTVSPASPQIAILEPGPGWVNSPTAAAAVTTGQDPHRHHVVWVSSVDAEVAHGVSAIIQLTPGKHTLSAQLIDDAGATIVTDQIEISVD